MEKEKFEIEYNILKLIVRTPTKYIQNTYII